MPRWGFWYNARRTRSGYQQVFGKPQIHAKGSALRLRERARDAA